MNKRCKYCKKSFYTNGKNIRLCNGCRKLRRENKQYLLRNKILIGMGYKNYKDYLESRLWIKTRLKVLTRDKFKCRICGNFGGNIHHLRYDRATLLGKSIKGMITLCGECHKYIEFEDGKKLKFGKVTAKYYKALKVNKNNLMTEQQALEEIKQIMGA